ncbi:hypothetical protein NQ038_13395 [Brevibacterium sp. 50QC2O2]|uniref:hypothetical protein n=1 Tax=Brevibacterium TaxID=1696 RepID=UPI00211C283A|nr:MULTISPECIES: hypothetical protein [unclassified Brevibacterium]MCQ9368584.1 hypothetical protein [Brevibacterium sp. 91QC2O2]MCQ9387039.1 hypothetical protein [Brevibacterium sp. 68QC2CO]MCQ9389331.1 hypothetical protein [Brevibacterium sp. 50QC2O2]MCQ9389631.1 hypothetical protein [Brevibacterium sp. 50QC2O2]
MVSVVGFTVEEVREFVREYERQPYGSKGQWVKDKPFSRDKLRRWRIALYAGDLDRGLAPRDHSVMVAHSYGRTAYERARAKKEAEQSAEIQRLHARIEQLEGANDALGKAIGLLHQWNAQEPEPARTDEPKDSSGRRTNSSPD